MSIDLEAFGWCYGIHLDHPDMVDSTQGWPNQFWVGEKLWGKIDPDFYPVVQWYEGEFELIEEEVR